MAGKFFRIFLCVLVVLLLNSCSRVKRDGPPNFHVDETRIPNAVPKPEALSKYGNMRSYAVNGQRYYPMRSSNHYEAVGVASWYGTMFHAQRTSSGEVYNMLGMTAAHKTLPLPTYVEVTNLKNHRKIIVKVNDRGPFKPNRIIDLSYVAAKKLGMLGRGTAYVRVKAINPYTFGRTLEIAKRTPTLQSSHGMRMALQRPAANQLVYLQVGTYHSKVHAQQARRRLIALFKTPVRIYKGRGYRVQVGPIKDTATADKITQRLNRLGFKSNKLYGV
jgi:rare lipoprotein A